MFMGQYKHNLDAKGRIIVPARFRTELGERVVATKWFEGCLAIYTTDKWENFYEKLLTLPNTMKDTRTYLRTVMANAMECEFDTQGRILLAPSLIKEGNLDKACVFVGVGDHIELWSEEAWNNFALEADPKFEEVAEKLTEYMV